MNSLKCLLQKKHITASFSHGLEIVLSSFRPNLEVEDYGSFLAFGFRWVPSNLSFLQVRDDAYLRPVDVPKFTATVADCSLLEDQY